MPHAVTTRASPSGATGSLTRSLIGLLDRPISQADRQRAALHLLDWLGCVQLGRTAEVGLALARLADQSAAGPCTVVGAGLREAGMAALVNGGLGNVFEMDDVHRRSIMHPGDTVIAAAWAVAEREGSSAAQLLEAMIRGYEVAIRVGTAAGPSHYRNWYSTATCGVFGAAAACAHLLGLNPERSADALGQAGMMAAGLWQCRNEPTFSKQLAAGRSAQSGVLAADLARIGFPGPKQILEGSHGFFAACCDHADAGALLADPLSPWKLYEVSFKPWPACRHVHPAIEAALKLREQLPAVSHIESLTLRTYADAISFADCPEPETAHQARFSLQHAVAVAWLRGDMTLQDSEPAAIADPAIAALRGRVKVVCDEQLTLAYPERFGAVLCVRSPGGQERVATVQAVKGDPENPLSAQDLQDKALGLMSAAGLKPQMGQRIVQSCLDLAQDGPISALSAALRLA